MQLSIRLYTFALALCIAVPASSATCESMAGLALPGVTITAAQPVAASGITPAYCLVVVTLRPTADSDIKAEIWLPSSGWNGKLEVNGNGGWSGSISPKTLATGLQRGYATAMSDLGHEGGSASFALGHPEKLIDFGYRAAHETTVAAKSIIAAFYGNAPRLAYLSGCSAGGRSALMEAQRFPNDFDGIVAGSPGLDWTGRAIQSMQIAQAAHKDEASYIPPAKYATIHEAVLRACDELDGLKDGVLEDPTRCRFDPAELLCQDADGPSCLTKPQVETARAIYLSGSQRGSENGWATMAGPKVFAIGNDFFKFVVFENPAWDYKTFNLEADMARIRKAENGVLNAMDPHLEVFLGHGKLIQYHGWSDPQISPLGSVAYYQSAVEAMGGLAKVQEGYRLFMIPGMAHCGGGDGASTFDMLSALEQWVENGKAPVRIPASRIRNGQADRTRPLCPYPQLATYQGTGSPDDAANFICKAP